MNTKYDESDDTHSNGNFIGVIVRLAFKDRKFYNC